MLALPFKVMVKLGGFAVAMQEVWAQVPMKTPK
jgi:hypothetical protein